MKLRLYAYGLSLLLAGLVASPLAGAFPDDDFPVSNYPMFAGRRSADVSVASVVMVFPDGHAEPVKPQLVANDEVIQAFETIRQAIRQGPDAVDRLCRDVADGLWDSEATEVRVQDARYDAIAYFSGDATPSTVHVHGACEVRQ